MEKDAMLWALTAPQGEVDRALDAQGCTNVERRICDVIVEHLREHRDSYVPRSAARIMMAAHAWALRNGPTTRIIGFDADATWPNVAPPSVSP